MSFNIERFKNNFEDLGFLQTNKFEVAIFPPPFLSGRSVATNGQSTSVNEISRALVHRIEVVQIPGIQLLMDENIRYGNGPAQKQPFNARLSEIPINFIVDQYSELWNFWHNWINGIFQHSGTLNSASNPFPPSYKLKYKDEYSTDVEIRVYSNEGGLSQRIFLYQSFPTAISAIPLSWGDRSQPLRLSVTLTFSSYSIEKTAIV